MKQIFSYGEYSYEYYIEFGDRKSYTLVVRPDLRIIAKVPSGSSLSEVESFLKRKWQWLERQLKELRKYKKPSGEPQYVSGKSVYYLGRQYMIEVMNSKDDYAKLERGKLRIYTSKNLRNSEHNKRILDDWYGRNRDRVFKREYIKALELFSYDSIPQLGQRVMAKRWGSYTSDGKVLLNPRLIEAPREAIYYVCVHELCHRMSRKHDVVFYDELKKRLPNWHITKEALEINFG